jgi:hypothetical protein
MVMQVFKIRERGFGCTWPIVRESLLAQMLIGGDRTLPCGIGMRNLYVHTTFEARGRIGLGSNLPFSLLLGVPGCEAHLQADRKS